VDWEDRLDDWELELELGAKLDGSEWVPLERAAAETGVSRAALRTWYRTGQIASRLVDGPHGPQRLVPLEVVVARAEASPRLRKTAERRLGDEAQLEILRHRVDQLEFRLASLEQRLRPDRLGQDRLGQDRLGERRPAERGPEDHDAK
jgi:transposase